MTEAERLQAVIKEAVDIFELEGSWDALHDAWDLLKEEVKGEKG